jgi:hypothetical protein
MESKPWMASMRKANNFDAMGHGYQIGPFFVKPITAWRTENQGFLLRGFTWETQNAFPPEHLIRVLVHRDECNPLDLRWAQGPVSIQD